jgi:hypothetical protein
MKKVLALLVLALFMVGMTNAQPGKIKLGVGPYVGIPMGSFGDVASVGFGGMVEGQYDFGSQLVGTVDVGYLSFSGKDITLFAGQTVKYSTSIVPIWVGAKYYFSPAFYGVANLGLNMISFTVPGYTYNYFGFTYTTPDQSVSDSKFGFQIGVGYDMGNLDFSVRYGSFASDISDVSVLALYKFPLN